MDTIESRKFENFKIVPKKEDKRITNYNEKKSNFGYKNLNKSNSNKYLFKDTIKYRTFTNSKIVPKKEYKRINYTTGYYIGYVLNNKRDGKWKILL